MKNSTLKLLTYLGIINFPISYLKFYCKLVIYCTQMHCTVVSLSYVMHPLVIGHLYAPYRNERYDSGGPTFVRVAVNGGPIFSPIFSDNLVP